MDKDLLIAVAVAETALVALAVLALFGHAGWIAARRRHQRSALAASRVAVAAALDGQQPAPDGLKALAGLPSVAQIGLLIELGRSLSGVNRQRLADVAGAVGLVGKAERWCYSRRWGQRLRGVRLLTLLGRGERVVGPLLDDPRAEVRAQAAQWVADHPERAYIERLLAMVDDEEALCRFTVKDSLIRIGRASADPLLRYLADADGAPAPEALEVAAGIADARFLAPALRLLAATDPHMRARAATLVGAIGGARATGALVESLVDPHADVRAAAARALGHLGHWPAAAALAACMRDASWEVRRAAATALKAIGPAGVLLLHRALTDRDRFTRDMARQILQLPVVERPVAHDLRELASAS